MKPTRGRLRLASEIIRQLTSHELGRAAAGRRDTPITPECPSDYTACPNSCSD